MNRLTWIAVTALIIGAAPSPAPGLEFGNTSDYLGEGQWAWRVALQGAPEELDRITSVDYILPPEIDGDRLKTRVDREGHFGLEGRSWGSFDILAIVTYERDFRNKELFQYTLQLQKRGAREVRIRNWAKPVPDSDRWDWGIWVDEGPEVLRQIEHVEYTLHPTFKDRIREEWDQATQFEHVTNGWGTFPIKVLVFFKDGTTFSTVHQLEFQGVPRARRMRIEPR